MYFIWSIFLFHEKILIEEEVYYFWMYVHLILLFYLIYIKNI